MGSAHYLEIDPFELYFCQPWPDVAVQRIVLRKRSVELFRREEPSLRARGRHCEPNLQIFTNAGRQRNDANGPLGFRRIQPATIDPLLNISRVFGQPMTP